MSKLTSIYLDILRIVAAVGVVFVHANLHWFSNGKFLNEEYGHKLVMVFFVLSGFLVAYSTDQKKKNLSTYIIDRGSRLYSVVIAALVFTYFLDGIGTYLNPTFYESHIAATGQWWRALLNVTFLQQNWHLCTKPSGNGTFWSIAYEFWYYMLFGVYVYVPTVANKWIIIFLICLFIGIKIILLLPVWAMGAIVYRLSTKLDMSHSQAIIGFLLSLIVAIAFTVYHARAPFENYFTFGQPPLFFSSRFAMDYAYGAIVAINILFLTFIKLEYNSLQENMIVIKLIRMGSSTTFTLYLFHLPMLLFIGAVVPYQKDNYLHLIPLIVIIFIIVYFISSYTEPSRFFYKNIGEWGLKKYKLKLRT